MAKVYHNGGDCDLSPRVGVNRVHGCNEGPDISFLAPLDTIRAVLGSLGDADSLQLQV
jgi:hypothetical protein